MRSEERGRVRTLPRIVLPSAGRIAAVEELVRSNSISTQHAAILIESYPVSPEEMIKLFDESKRLLGSEFGIEVPDYKLRFAPPYTLPGMQRHGFYTNWLERKFGFPPEGLIDTPITIAHEQVHAHHAENSAIYRKLRAVYDREDESAIDEIVFESDHILEGWPVLISELFAKIRDRRIGKEMYQSILESGMQRLAWRDISHGTRNRAAYYEGGREFRRIFERDGLEGVKKAANTLVTNDQLADY